MNSMSGKNFNLTRKISLLRLFFYVKNIMYVFGIEKGSAELEFKKIL